MQSNTKPTICQVSLVTNSKMSRDGILEPFGKVAWIDEAGQFHSETRASVVRATFQTMNLHGIRGAADFMTIGDVGSSSCLLYGVHTTLTSGLIDSQGEIRRTDDNFPRLKGRPGILNFDFDDQPERGIVAPSLEEIEALLCSLVPWWGRCIHFAIPSSSSSIFRADGTPTSPKRGWRVIFLIDDSSQAARVGHEVVAALFRAGHGRVVVNVSEGLSVSRLWRSMLDDSVWPGSKPDFVFGAWLLSEGLYQSRAAVWFATDGAELVRADEVADTGGLRAFKETPEGRAMLAAVDAEFTAARERVRGDFVSGRVRDGWEASAAGLTFDAVERGELADDWRLYFRGGDCSATIAEIRREPALYDGMDCCDPAEPNYRGWANVAQVRFHNDMVRIVTQAHGGPHWYTTRPYTPDDVEALKWCSAKEGLKVFGGVPAPDVPAGVQPPIPAVEAAALPAKVLDEIDVINERFAHIDKVCAFWDVLQGVQVKFSQIVEKFAPLQIPIEVPDGEDVKIKYIPATQMWFKSEKRRWHSEVTYIPGGQRDSVCGGVLNCWTGWGFDLSDLDSNAHFVIEDYRMLTMGLANNNLEDAHRITQWDAWGLQNPGIKLRRGEVFASVVQGTGKTLHAEALGSLHGSQNTLIVGDDAFSGKFSDHMRCRTLIVGEELFNDPKTAGRSSSGLKRLVANDTIDTEGKGEKRMVFPNVASIMALSNHPDALRIDINDRRWDVYAPNVILPKEFYARFAGHRQTASGRAAMAHYLLNYDLSGFDPNARAIMTGAKMTMIEAGRSDLEAFLKDRTDDETRDIWTAEELQQTYNKMPTVIPASQVTLRAVVLALARMGAPQRRPNIPANPATGIRAKSPRLYALRNIRLWEEANEGQWLNRKLS